MHVKKKPLKKTTALGAALFGIGWASPAPVRGRFLAQVGEGKLLGLFTMLGMVLGTYIYALIKQKRPNI